MQSPSLAYSIETCPLAGLVPPGPDRTDFAVTRSIPQWKARLNDLEFSVMRDARTEPAHSSPLADQTAAGTYVCKGCNAPLYASAAKFDAGIGRPTFSRALPGAIGKQRRKVAFLSRRMTCHCARCGSHLGHITEDGPPTSGQRHTLNGASLVFDRA